MNSYSTRRQWRLTSKAEPFPCESKPFRLPSHIARIDRTQCVLNAEKPIANIKKVIFSFILVCWSYVKYFARHTKNMFKRENSHVFFIIANICTLSKSNPTSQSTEQNATDLCVHQKFRHSHINTIIWVLNCVVSCNACVWLLWNEIMPEICIVVRGEVKWGEARQAGATVTTVATTVSASANDRDRDEDDGDGDSGSDDDTGSCLMWKYLKMKSANLTQLR